MVGYSKFVQSCSWAFGWSALREPHAENGSSVATVLTHEIEPESDQGLPRGWKVLSVFKSVPVPRPEEDRLGG